MVNKFTKNLVYAFFAQFISMFLSVLMSLILPKILGVREFSYWQLFHFYCGFVGLFHFGLSDGIYLRYGGTNLNDLNKQLIGSQYKLMIFWQAIIAGVVIAFVCLFASNSLRSYVWIMISIYLVIANATWFLGYVFQAANETRLYSTANIISNTTFIVFIITFIILEISNFKAYIFLFVTAQFIAFLYCLKKGKAFVVSGLMPFKDIILEMCSNMKIGISLTVSNIAGSLILGFGRFFVDYKWGVNSFGVFSLALSLTNFILLFINQISMVLFPALRQKDAKIQCELFLIIRDNLGIVLCGALIFYVPIKVILIGWLPQYKESFYYLVFILPICIFDGKMQMLYNTYLKVMRKEKILLRINFFCCILSFLFCYISILLFSNIYFIVLSIVIALVLRSIISSIYLSKIMKVTLEKSILYEITLSLLFIIVNVYLKAGYAFLTYLLFYFGSVCFIRWVNKR